MSNKKGKKKDDYWESGAAEADAELVSGGNPTPAPPSNEDGVKKGKSKPAAKPADEAPAAEEKSKPAPGGKKGKKKKDDDYWESGAADEDAAIVASEKLPVTAEANGSSADGKKKGGNAKTADLLEPEAPKQPAAAKGGKGAKGKKKKDDDYWEKDFEADAELLNKPAEAPAPAEPAAAKGGKGGKGKDKPAAAPASPTPAKAAPAPAAPAPAAKPEAPTAEGAPAEAASSAAPAEEGKEADAAEGDAKEDAPEAAAAGGGAKGKDKKGKKKPAAPVKVDPKEARRQAIAKAIKEQQAQQKAIEEEQARLAEIEKKRREEEERIAAEEAKREEEERERKRIARKKKEEEAKKRKEAEAEEERRRNALSRYVGAPGQLPPAALAAAAKDGATEGEGAAAAAGEKKKRPIYEKKGAKAGKKPTDASAESTPAAASLASSSQSVDSTASALATAVAASSPAPAPAPAPALAAPAPAPVEVEEDSWDTKDIEADIAKLKPAEPAAAPTPAPVEPTPAAAAPAAAPATAAAVTADTTAPAAAAASGIERETAETPAPAKPKKKSDKKDKKPEKGKLSMLPNGEPELRSPICCVLGHVDTGKTKLLDKIRRTNYQEGEAGGITQQIGATYFPIDVLRERTKLLAEKTPIEIKIPGLLVIDTPGHESFNNLRTRGSSLCDIAILVVDIMHGLEPQTIESIGLLKRRKCPFVVALNKVDRLYGWEPHPNSPIQATLKTQNHDVKVEFEQRVQQTITAFAEQGLNASLYYKNPDVRKYISLVPTSAHTGEGIPDLLNLLTQLTQRMMKSQLTLSDKLVCTVLEVKPTEGHGTTIDVVLSDGEIHEGDTIVVCGMNGPIVTNIRALLTPQPLKELRIKGQYQHHKVLRAAQGVKIAAHDLETAVAGSQLMVVGPNDDVEKLKKSVMGDFAAVMDKYIDKGGKGVFVQASSLGSLEALLDFLKVSEIPVVGVSLGNIHKKDVMKAGVMLERAPEFAVILAFDVHPTAEAKALAEHTGVRIFTADIIYHLFDQFTAYMKGLREEKKKSAGDAVFPVVLSILQVFNKKNPLIAGVKVTEGTLRLNTPLCIPTKDFTFIGRVTSIESNKKPQEKAKRGEDVAIRIEGADGNFLFGRNFTETDALVSQITYDTIEALREYYTDEMTKEDEELLTKLEIQFGRRLQPQF